MLKPHACSAPPDQPKPGECPVAQPGLCQERCRGDSDCPDAQKCCNSSCGRQCVPAAPAGETGWDGTGSAGRAVAWGPGVMPRGHGQPEAQSRGTMEAPSLWARWGGLCRGWQDRHCLSPTSRCCSLCIACTGGRGARGCGATGVLPTTGREGPGWGPSVWLPGGHWDGEGAARPPCREATLPLSPPPC